MVWRVRTVDWEEFGYPGYRFMFPIRIPIFNDPGKRSAAHGPDFEQLVARAGYTAA